MHQAYAHSTAFSGVSRGKPAPSSLVLRCSANRALTRHALALYYACRQCVLLSCSARSSPSMFAALLNDSFVAFLIAAETSSPPTISTPPLSRQRQYHLQVVGSLLILLRETVDLMLEVAIFRPSLGRRSFISDACRRHKTLNPPRQQHDDHTRQRRPEKATCSLKRLPSPFAAPAGSCDIDRGGGQSSEGISAAMTRPATPPQRSTVRELASGDCG